MRTYEARAVGLLVCGFAVAYTIFGLFRHWHFASSAFDLGIFYQAVWHLSRFRAPASSISGFSNILGDHFYPIIVCFAPLYWLRSGPETLIVAQSVLLAGSIVPVYLHLRTNVAKGTALTLCVSFGLFWGLQRAMSFDVHAVAFAPLLIATTLLALRQRRWTLFWVSSVVVMLIREDLVPVLVALGLYLTWQGEQLRGAALAALSLIAFVLIVGIVIPALGDSGQYAYTSVFDDALRDPWLIPATLVTPPVKVLTAFMWLAPFAFLPSQAHS